ncbi:flagellar hook capping FlgD N-terminal domain-containing protein [Breoghania sp.]|uniref:flagellar hook assembly protein FlgD n=1 Tax=Breoghania sp. TaxID=2065378 RepID=UPI00261D2D77|nr:flagellar hook capping FlgD N-terminal domain-containing protein [Breoghania sp.]MDJ0931602.1 flagellar hook capping FlgD N-terminal domain-containing protein [Breoghania sp.]
MVDSVSGTSSSSEAAVASTSSTALSANYEMLLSLLTTQLKVQDPLDPLKAEEFTNQLVQYSSVKQQIQMNSSMATLIEKVSASNATNLVSYLGQTVTADGNESVLNDGYATWKFNTSAAADGAEITIQNSSGAIVYMDDDVDLLKGSGAYVWDGRTDSGSTASDGAYTISFFSQDNQGKNVSVTTEVVGVVDGVDFSSSDPVLKMGDVSIPLSSVTSVTSVSLNL